MGKPRLRKATLVLVRHVALESLVQLGSGRERLFIFDDAGPHAHHVRQSPESNAIPVGETAATMPPHVLDESVYVLLELPGQARLSDPADAHDGHEMGPALSCRNMEQLFDEMELTVTSHKGWLQLALPNGATQQTDD